MILYIYTHVCIYIYICYNMYVLFNDHLKEEGEQNVKLQICNGQNNSSSENVK